jgi:hypothetical protein
MIPHVFCSDVERRACFPDGNHADASETGCLGRSQNLGGCQVARKVGCMKSNHFDRRERRSTGMYVYTLEYTMLKPSVRQ